MAERPAVPNGVLLQNVLVDPHDREGGYRVYEDGRIERRSMGREWVQEAPLASEQVQNIRTAIRDAGLERLRDRYEPDAPPADDGGSTLHVHALREGRVQHVAVVRPCRVPELDALIVRVSEIFQQGR
jgi:hypothetical protein